MKVYFYTLMLCFFATFTLSAQTVWLGNTDSDWLNETNWSAGIPTNGMTITIPGNPAGGNFPVFAGGPIIDYTIQNAGTITFNSLVYNNGTIINFGGGIINIDGQFINAGMGFFDNDGILNVNSEFTNYGSFDHALSGEVNVVVGATYTHAGLFFKSAGPFLNRGLTVNNSNMRSTNLFENFGTLINNNSYESPFGSIFNNHSNGVITNPAGSIFVVNGEFTNNAPFTNDGEFQIQTATVGINTATITNNDMFDVSGSLVNDGSIINNDRVEIKDGGTLTNNNVVTNNGSITLAICGTLVQNGGNNIAAPVLNDGLIFLLNGTVNWTNLEFGNEFTDLSSTKPPVAGCLAGIFVSLDQNGEATVSASQVDKGSYGSCGTSLTSVSIDRTDFSTSDLGSNLVTLTIEDNLGISSSCQSVVTILPYIPPVVAIDDADIDFNCPDDITSTTLPGAVSAEASWTLPTATSNCVGATECVTRTATNTIHCNSSNSYGFYLKLTGLDYNYAISNAVLKEFEDGTALFTALATNNGNSNYQFNLDFTLSGRTFVEPGTPKDNGCISVNTSDWYYYTSTVGTASGIGALEGASVSFTRIGEAFQIGNGANATDGTNGFGGSGWLDGNIDVQPTNGPTLTRFVNTNPQFADINIMLSGDGNECRPLPQCSAQEAIPGFVFVGEYNDSKYYCSNTNNYTWAQAKALAEANGGHLAIPNNAGENTFLQNNILADWAWLGISDEANEGSWINTFGQAQSYLNWNAGEPNNGGGIEDYVRILKSNGKWTDRDANFLAEVIMEVPCSNGPPSCSTLSNNISGFTFLGEYNNSKYYGSHNASSWNTAQTNCAANGGHLVVIGDQAENDFVQNNINPASGSIWTGLNTVSSPNVFEWINGETVGYTNWNPGEPNGSGIDIGTRLVKSHGKWTDRAVTDQFEYVMEISCSGNSGGGPSGPPVVTQIRGPQSGDNFAVGVTEVVYEITDDCGNQEICVFEVTVDQTPSEITLNDCPGNIIINTLPGATSAPVTWNTITASTTCYNDGLVLEQVLGPQIGDIVRVKDGAQAVSYNATDSCGNFANCFFSVTVVATPSEITMFDCSDDIVVEAGQNENAVAVSWDAPTGTSSCFTGSVSVTQLDGLASGSDFTTGTSTRIIYLVSDECGNTEICIFNVVVNEPACPAAGTSCDDNVLSTFNDIEDGNCNCAGTPSSLQITCSDNISVSLLQGLSSVEVNFNEPSVNGNCPNGVTITQTAGLDSGSEFPLGTFNISYEVTDNCGNVESCSFDVTVLPFSCAVDADGDGICAVDDCDDNDATLPATAGTSCDDGDATTENDVIGADGCSCAGTQIDPCATAGGDADGDGICAADDCDDNDANFPMAAGTSCDDGDATTENDVIGADGCSCAGTQIDPCAAAGGDADGDGICAADDCDDNDATLPAAAGTSCNDNDDSTENDVIGADGCSCAGTQIDPCDVLGGDADGDGICAMNDCDDNDPSLPAVAGTSCDDGDADTENDVFGSDGCSCAGTPINNGPDCNDIVITPGVGEVTISGLNASINSIQVFNAQWQQEFKCFADCDAPINVVSGLSEGTHFIKVALYTANYQEICAVEDYYEILGGDPCANAGGDADGDGYCAADDCDDNDASLPAAPGTSCDDGDANTINDVIGSDGCSCAGAPIGDPCALAGGDADGDGVCADNDCDDNDASLPMIAGTSCDDGDSNTNNDIIQSDGCTCEGSPIVVGPDCGNVGIVASDGFITVTNLDESPISSVQIFNSSWNQVFRCAGDCNATELIAGLDPGTYFVKVALYTANWQPICAVEDYFQVTSGNGDPCAAFGGDADGDGVCADLDCDDNDVNFPMAVGTACDDGDPVTVQDVILADGCTCEGKIHNTGGTNCDNITITLGDGTITVAGLEFAPITSIQIFDESWSQVFKCAGDCNTSTQVVDGLGTGTYFVKVAFYNASWQLECDVEDFYNVTNSLGANSGQRRQMDFTVQKGPRQVEILWGTNTGLINDYFMIERSIDGQNFEELTSVDNRFDNDDFNTYTTTDINPYAGISYYRMKQIHKDGTYIYSGKRMVNFEGDFNQFTVFPNPTSDQVYIHLKSFSGLPVTIEFYDALGRITMQQYFNAAPEVPQQFDTSDLNEGSYLVTVKFEGRKLATQRLVIIKQ